VFAEAHQQLLDLSKRVFAGLVLGPETSIRALNQLPVLGNGLLIRVTLRFGWDDLQRVGTDICHAPWLKMGQPERKYCSAPV
jgi:hypothetical protein